MAILVNTREVIDNFCKVTLTNEKTYESRRSQVDREEVYEYEIELDKDIFHMTPEELLTMLSNIQNKRRTAASRTKKNINYSTYATHASIFRALFDYYASNYEVIINPWNNPQMKGQKAVKVINSLHERYTVQQYLDTLKKLHENYGTEKAEYLELMMRLAFDGFCKTEDYITVKEGDIDFYRNTIRIDNRVITTSPRTMELFKKFHDKEAMDETESRFKIVLMSYNNSYFKFPVRCGFEGKFQQKKVKEVCNTVNRKFCTDINDVFGTNFTVRILYCLGFYEFVKSRIGEDELREIVYQNGAGLNDLMKVADDYSYNYTYACNIKKELMSFITE